MRVGQSQTPKTQSTDVRQTGQAASAKSQKTESTRERGSSVAVEGVKPEISAKAKDAATAKAKAVSTPDVREDRIAELKRRIAAGTYQVDADRVADRLVDEHMETAAIG